MKLSPLQLVRYLVPEVLCIANADYDPDEPKHFGSGSLQVSGGIKQMESDQTNKFTSWSVELETQLEPGDDTNVPYKLSVKIVGLFRCSSASADMPAEVFVKANGSSILYGTVREMVRSLTGVGPWGALMLPTLSFTPDPPLHPKTAAKRKGVKRIKNK